MLAISLMAAALLPLAYYGVVIDTARRFARRSRTTHIPHTGPVSVLKPVRGLDPGAFERYASFCQQEYPEYEVLFGVAEADDPAIPVIRQVMARFPAVPIRLICPIRSTGPNAKMSIVRALAADARHAVLVVADSDVSAPASLLAELTGPFSDAHVGVVSCLYRGDSSGSVSGDLEALAISTEFIPGVLVAERLEGVRFALGAVMAVRRARVDEIGGFEALVDCCADDFELGRRIHARGSDVRLVDCVVSTACDAASVASLLRHQLRWAVTQRHSRPRAWIAKAVVTQGLPWCLAAACVAPSPWLAGLALGAYAALRAGVAWTVGDTILGDATVRRRWWMLPVVDAILCGISIAALVTNQVDWRGRRFVLDRGRLVPGAPAPRSRVRVDAE